MAANDLSITLVCLMKLELVEGHTARFCDGGFLDFASDGETERYESEDPVFGSIMSPGEHEVGFGDRAERGVIGFAPPESAAMADWYGDHLLDARLRTWAGELGGDGKSVVDAVQLDDLLVDTYEQTIGAGGNRVLELGFISRGDKVFLRNEGNVASERFQKSLFPNEDGFNNCTDVPTTLAWGALAPSNGSTVRGGGGARPGGAGGGTT